jgi:hypothetical protein
MASHHVFALHDEKEKWKGATLVRHRVGQVDQVGDSARTAEVQLRLASSRAVLLERLLKPRLLRFVLVSLGNVDVKLLGSPGRGDHRQHARLGKAEAAVPGDDIVIRDDAAEENLSQTVRAPQCGSFSRST